MKKYLQYIYWVVGAIVIIAAIYGLAQLGGSTYERPSDPFQIVESDNVKGNKEARVVLFEYSDLQCPACGAYQPVIRDLATEFGEELLFVYRHFPLSSIHHNAVRAAQAAEAAGSQGQFFAMHDLLFENQSQWAKESDPYNLFKGYALTLGLSLPQWEGDFASKETKDKINGQATIGNSLGVNATPTFFLNGVKITNPKTYGDFKTLIQAELAK